MRKQYRLLLLALVVAALACTALAADPAAPVPGTVTFTENVVGSLNAAVTKEETPEADQKVEKFESVTLDTSPLTPGSQALLLMVRADATGIYAYDEQTLSEKNIVYIDQAEVGANGSVTFNKVYPSLMCNSVLLLGGGEKLQVLKEVRVELEKGDVNEVDGLDVNDFLMMFNAAIEVPGTFCNRAQEEMAASLDGMPGLDITDFLAAFNLVFEIS